MLKLTIKSKILDILKNHVAAIESITDICG